MCDVHVTQRQSPDTVPTATKVVGRAENWGERKTTVDSEGSGTPSPFSPPPPPPLSFSAHPSFPPAPRSDPGSPRMDRKPLINNNKQQQDKKREQPGMEKGK